MLVEFRNIQVYSTVKNTSNVSAIAASNRVIFSLFVISYHINHISRIRFKIIKILLSGKRLQPYLAQSAGHGAFGENARARQSVRFFSSAQASILMNRIYDTDKVAMISTIMDSRFIQVREIRSNMVGLGLYSCIRYGFSFDMMAFVIM